MPLRAIELPRVATMSIECYVLILSLLSVAFSGFSRNKAAMLFIHTPLSTTVPKVIIILCIRLPRKNTSIFTWYIF